MARLPDLFVYARKHQLKIISIADLISYRLKTDRFIIREAIADLPTEFGNFQIYGYRNLLDNSEATAIVKGNPERFTQEPILVRIHSECLTGDALGSLRCDCRQQLQTALRLIEAEGQGVVVYLKQEGRGIGLVNKLKAYSLQDKGLDTITANEQLLTNNPRKVVGLKGWDLNIVERVPLAIEENSYNSHYLATKAEKLGHFL